MANDAIIRFGEFLPQSQDPQGSEASRVAPTNPAEVYFLWAKLLVPFLSFIATNSNRAFPSAAKVKFSIHLLAVTNLLWLHQSGS